MQSVWSTIGGLGLFSNLTCAEQRRLEMAARRITPKKGDTLFRRGDVPGHVYCLIKGTVSLSLLSPLGVEKVVEILRSEGDIIGAESALLDTAHCLTAQALQPCELIQIRREAFAACVAENHGLALRMMQGFGGRLQGYIKDIEGYSLCSAAQRLAEFLLAEAVAQRQTGEEAVIELQSSKTVVASLLNLAPETLSRTFKMMSDKGFITVQGMRIALHGTSRLRQVCSETEKPPKGRGESYRSPMLN